MKIRVRCAGAPDFEVEFADATVTVADAKIDLTSGCDMDPDCMRVVFKGRVLKDDDTLEVSGLHDGATLHVARGKPAAPAATPSAPAGLRLRLRGPGGVDMALDDLGPDTSLSQVVAR